MAGDDRTTLCFCCFCGQRMFQSNPAGDGQGTKCPQCGRIHQCGFRPKAHRTYYVELKGVFPYQDVYDRVYRDP